MEKKLKGILEQDACFSANFTPVGKMLVGKTSGGKWEDFPEIWTAVITKDLVGPYLDCLCRAVTGFTATDREILIYLDLTLCRIHVYIYLYNYNIIRTHTHLYTV